MCSRRKKRNQILPRCFEGYSFSPSVTPFDAMEIAPTLCLKKEETFGWWRNSEPVVEEFELVVEEVSVWLRR